MKENFLSLKIACKAHFSVVVCHSNSKITRMPPIYKLYIGGIKYIIL